MKQFFDILFRLFSPSVHLRVFTVISVCIVVAAIGSLWLPWFVLIPVLLYAIYFILKKDFHRPLNELLQLTRRGGLDLASTQHVVNGRDEFSRLARGIYGMAKRMRESIIEARDQTARLDEIFNVIGEGVIIVDESIHILKINHTAEKWLGWYDYSVGRRLVDIVKSIELSEKISAMGQTYSQTGDTRFVEPAIIDSLALDGPEKKMVRVKIVAVRRDTGLVFMIFLFDISDLHRMQDIRREFFANVSHELKTPMSSIRGYAETLADMPALENDPMAKQFLSVIVRNTFDLTRLIDEMLVLTSIESGAFVLNLKPYDIRLALERVVETLLPKAKEAQIEIHADVSSEVDELWVDPQRIDSVLLNLVDNAIKYNRPGGYVKVSVRLTATDCILYFEDNGQGISDVAQLRAFERFYRVDKSHSRLGGGSGLGLAIVKHTVQAHGGHITLRSELGIGTVFTVTLPRQRRGHQTIEPVTPF